MAGKGEIETHCGDTDDISEDGAKDKSQEGSSQESENDSSSSYESVEYEFPKTLEEFGYRFDEFGQLRHLSTDEPFKFQEKEDDQDYNQKRYEALGDIITGCVYKLILDEGTMKKQIIPVNASESEPSTFIFYSNNAFTTADKLIILIHGSGVVRAGQWSRRLIINDRLNSGTQLPFIRRSHGLGYGVIVLNTNDNIRNSNGSSHRIRGSETAENHANYVWKHVICRVPAKHVAIIAHSYGGVVAVHLANSFQLSFQERIFAVALTDSPHSLVGQGTPPALMSWLQKVSRNWVSSHFPLDTPLSLGNKQEIECVSAGHQRHDMTSWSSFASIFEFIDRNYRGVLSAAYEREHPDL